jgi:hypothetical protein
MSSVPGEIEDFPVCSAFLSPQRRNPSFGHAQKTQLTGFASLGRLGKSSIFAWLMVVRGSPR